MPAMCLYPQMLGRFLIYNNPDENRRLALIV
jgi:hypothetical protein